MKIPAPFAQAKMKKFAKSFIEKERRVGILIVKSSLQWVHRIIIIHDCDKFTLHQLTETTCTRELFSSVFRNVLDSIVLTPNSHGLLLDSGNMLLLYQIDLFC